MADSCEREVAKRYQFLFVFRLFHVLPVPVTQFPSCKLQPLSEPGQC